MSNQSSNLDVVRTQFRRQADEFARMAAREEKFLASIVSLSDPRPSDRVLDVACGPGFLTMAFAACSAAAVGFDVTDKFILGAAHAASSKEIENVHFVIGDAARLAFADHSFDLVACKMAFHHLPEPADVLAQMLRVAQPRGKVVITDLLTSEDPARADYHNRLERLCDPSHARTLPESEFERIFIEHRLATLAKRRAQIGVSVADWLAHAAPPPDNVAQINQLIDAAIDADLAGLNMRRADGQLYVTYTIATWLLRTPGSQHSLDPKGG